MACQTLTKKIDEIDYTTVQFPAREALKLMTRLVKQIGPIFDGDFKSLLTNLDDSSIQLIVDLLAKTSRNNLFIDSEKFDEYFTGEYPHLLNVLTWVIDSNSFFGKDAIGNLMKSYKTTAAIASPLQVNSSKSNTDSESAPKKKSLRIN